MHSIYPDFHTYAYTKIYLNFKKKAQHLHLFLKFVTYCFSKNASLLQKKCSASTPIFEVRNVMFQQKYVSSSTKMHSIYLFFHTYASTKIRLSFKKEAQHLPLFSYICFNKNMSLLQKKCTASTPFFIHMLQQKYVSPSKKMHSIYPYF